MSDDTIYALATPAGRSGVAVVRLSGDGARRAIEVLTHRPVPCERRAVLRALYAPQKEEMIDRALVLYFAGPRSFTGEDIAEFHIHGGAAVIEGVLEACAHLSGLRAAQAGEFSRRAFLNGRSDLAEIEGLADLVAAETALQRRQALRQMGGEMSGICETWRDDLLSILAQMEARLDFPDEMAGDSDEDFLARLNKISEEIGVHLNDQHSGERLRAGVQVAIIGAPNVGKSTLLNFLAGRDVAIVSPHAGTTRDVLEVALDLKGWPVIVRDMAGLREAGDEIEAEGVRRACVAAQEADLRLVILAADVDDALNRRALSLMVQGDIVVVNKTDLSQTDLANDFYSDFYPEADLRLCLKPECRSGGDELLDLLTQRAADLCGSGASPLITRARHREALRDCHQALNRAAAAAVAAAVPELLAEDLRLALVALGRITGRVGVEDMLDKLFAEFCIGK